MLLRLLGACKRPAPGGPWSLRMDVFVGLLPRYAQRYDTTQSVRNLCCDTLRGCAEGVVTGRVGSGLITRLRHCATCVRTRRRHLRETLAHVLRSAVACTHEQGTAHRHPGPPHPQQQRPAAARRDRRPARHPRGMGDPVRETREPTVARSFSGSVWHDLNRGRRDWRTMCGLDASSMARFSPSDLPSGERAHRTCSRCRKARGV